MTIDETQSYYFISLLFRAELIRNFLNVRYNDCLTQITASDLCSSILFVFSLLRWWNPQEFPCHMTTLVPMSWIWLENLESHAFHSDAHDLFLFFQTPSAVSTDLCLARAEDRLERESQSGGWKHRAYMQPCDEACALHICFHFGVCFQVGARKYIEPPNV